MKRKITTIIVGLFLLIMAAVPAGANASSTDRGQNDLSTLPAIEAYLASIGIGMESVVVQQGPLNYAGPFCPGDGWNCTSATRVVQISTATSGANIFDCLPALNALIPALNECLIVQSSVSDPLETATSVNSASCNADTSDGSGRSKCTIRQQAKKGNNNANVNQRINQRGHSPQTATEYADIDQKSFESGKNTARVTQTIQQTLDIDPTPPVTQQQQASQTAKVTQNTGGGNNSSDVQQTMLQVEDAQSNSDITQDQNTDLLFAPNQDATVTQTTSTGANTSNLQHQLTQRQHANSCTTCTITQNQGLPSPGGQRGSVTQTAGGVTQNSTASQNESQTQDAGTFGTLIRTKFGPQDCCTTQNGGTADNNCLITQSNDQEQTPTAFPNNPNMNSEQKGTAKEDVFGAKCSLDQTYTANGVPHHHTESGMVIAHDRFCSANGETNSCSDEDF